VLKGDAQAARTLREEFAGLCDGLDNAQLRVCHLARYLSDPLPFLVLRERIAGARTLYLGDGAADPGFSERGLFLLWRAGDRQAGEFFCQRILDRLYGFVVREARRRGKFHALDDFLQDFFIKLATKPRHLEKAERCDDEAFFVHCQWELRYTVMGGELLHNDPEEAAPVADRGLSPPDILEREEQSHRMFDFLSSRTCRVPENIRENLILFNMGVTHEAIHILTATPVNTSKNRCREAKLSWERHEVAGATESAPAGFSLAQLEARAGAWEARAVENRRLLQDGYFSGIDALISTRDARVKGGIQHLLAQPEEPDEARDGDSLREIVRLAGLSLTTAGFTELLVFLRRLRTLEDCEAREAVLLWDLVRCPLASMVLYTVNATQAAGVDPLELVFQRWCRGARHLLGRDWRAC